MRGRNWEPWAAAAFACLPTLLFLDKPFHIDEPFFLAVARHILASPLRPYDFLFNWYGRELPYAQLNNNPPLLPYILAAALRVCGGREWALRLFFLPLDALTGLGLYGIAARFLRRPLWPVLTALATPAFFVNAPHLMAEKPALAAGFLGLWLLIEGFDGGGAGRLAGGTALLALAGLFKYNALFLLPPAIAYGWSRRAAPRRLAEICAAAVAPTAAFLSYAQLAQHSGFSAMRRVFGAAAGLPAYGWPHTLRSIPAFAGGCGVVLLLWPWLLIPRRSALACAALAGLLFLPVFDIGFVRPIDRACALLFSAGALAALWETAAQPSEGRLLWACWAASGLLMNAFYWSVMARLMPFLLPPLIFSLADALQARWDPRRLRTLELAGAAAALALSLALASVDYAYAWAQKDLAAFISRAYAGRRVWCASHWGLQYYLQAAGALELDRDKGGWAAPRPGDVVVLSRVNADVLHPEAPVRANVRWVLSASRIPLRLMSGWKGQGGFYSSFWGFLPYSISREPVDEFEIVELPAAGSAPARKAP